MLEGKKEPEKPPQPERILIGKPMLTPSRHDSGIISNAGCHFMQALTTRLTFTKYGSNIMGDVPEAQDSGTLCEKGVKVI